MQNTEEKFIIPDDGDTAWAKGAETFTRQEVFALLYTQRAMIANDLKRMCYDELGSRSYSILENPRIPEF